MRRPIIIAAAIMVLVAITVAWFAFDRAAEGRAQAERLAQGRYLYVEHCAVCHGENLEGQPNWQERLPNGRMPAPPHDATGHTWHHSDDQLFRITRDGVAEIVGGTYESDMPGFSDVLSDDEIRVILDYIKSTWPGRESEYQAQISERDQ